MSGKDILYSIYHALWEEERKAFHNNEIFKRDEITIFMSESAYLIASKESFDYTVVREHEIGKMCFGCNLKIVSEKGIKVYIGKQCTIFEEGAEYGTC